MELDYSNFVILKCSGFLSWSSHCPFALLCLMYILLNWIHVNLQWRVLYIGNRFWNKTSRVERYKHRMSIRILIQDKKLIKKVQR